MLSQKWFRVPDIKRSDIFWSSTFILLMVPLTLSAEWTVLLILVPLIMLAVRGSVFGIFFAGSVAVLLGGYHWIGWLKFYNIRTLVIGMTCWYFFYMFFVFAIRFLFSTQSLRFWNGSNISIRGNKSEGQQMRQSFFILVPPTVWFCIAKVASYTEIGSSWTDLAMFQPAMAPLIWVIGVRGITFFIILANSLIPAWIWRRSRGILMAALCLSLVVGGCLAYSRFASPPGETVKVALLRGNFLQSWKWRRNHADTIILETYLNMTAQDAGSYLVFGTITELDKIIDGKRATQNLAVIISPQPENTTVKQCVKDLISLFTSEGSV